MNIKSLKACMGLQGKPKPLAAIKVMHRFFFMHPGKGKPYTKGLLVKHITFICAMSWPVMIGVHGHVYQAFSDGMIEHTMGDLFYLTFMYILLIIGITYVFFGNSIENIIDLIESDTFEMPPALVKEFRIFNILTWAVFFAVMTIDSMDSVFYHITGKFCESRIETNDSRHRCGYHTAAWYPFEEDTFIKEWVLKLWFDVSEAIIISVNIATIVSLLGFLRFIFIRMQHFRRTVENFDETNMLAFSKNLEYLLGYHGQILQSVRELNNSLGYLLVVGYTLLTVLLSTMVYIVFLERRFTELHSLLLCYSFEAILCHFGQEWENEHEKLVRSVCNLPWYVLPPKQRKEYSLFLGAISIPVRFKAQPFTFVNYNLLLFVTRSAYRVLTFLGNNSE